MSWPPWFTSLGPPLFLWVMLAVTNAAFARAIVGVIIGAFTFDMIVKLSG